MDKLSKPPSILPSKSFKDIQTENMQVSNKINISINDINDVSAENPKTNDILLYKNNTWTATYFPLLFNYVGTIANLGGTDYIRWGQNVDGKADSVLIPYSGKIIAYTASMNDISPLVTGSSASWTIEIGLVHDSEGSNDVPNTSTNFNTMYTKTWTKEQLDATNGFPQWSEPLEIEVTAGDRLSARSTSSGITWTGADLVLTFYILDIPSLEYEDVIKQRITNT